MKINCLPVLTALMMSVVLTISGCSVVRHESSGFVLPTAKDQPTEITITAPFFTETPTPQPGSTEGEIGGGFPTASWTQLPASPELPDLPMVSQAVEDLARRLHISAEKIKVVKFEAVVWPDGSLGCPQPGMYYIQMLVEGYLIQLEYEGTMYAYHGKGSQSPFYCEIK